MLCYIIRHGEALSVWEDAENPALSPRGITQIEQVVRTLGERQAKSPTQLYVSPLQRAQQTAGILNQIWQLPLQIVDWLKPGTEASVILDNLQKCSEECVALVGHLPSLGWLVHCLAEGLPPRDRGLVKGSVTCVGVERWEAGAGTVEWTLIPEANLD